MEDDPSNPVEHKSGHNLINSKKANVVYSPLAFLDWWEGNEQVERIIRLVHYLTTTYPEKNRIH